MKNKKSRGKMPGGPEVSQKKSGKKKTHSQNDHFHLKKSKLAAKRKKGSRPNCAYRRLARGGKFSHVLGLKKTQVGQMKGERKSGIGAAGTKESERRGEIAFNN